MTDKKKKSLNWGMVVPVTIVVVFLAFLVYAGVTKEGAPHSHDGGALHTD